VYAQILFLAVGHLIFASTDGNSVDLGLVTARNEKIVARALPADFAQYQERLVRDGGPKDDNETILLAKKAKAYLLNRDPALPKESDRIRVYVAAWELCLRQYEVAKDEETKNRILDAWNRELRVDDEAVPFQIYAINYPWWNRTFLTGDF
jgi:hypothetical protein